MVSFGCACGWLRLGLVLVGCGCDYGVYFALLVPMLLVVGMVMVLLLVVVMVVLKLVLPRGPSLVTLIHSSPP